MKRAFITGITGQDGSYLCELLLRKDYEIHGLIHRPDSVPHSNIGHLARDEKLINKRLFLHNGTFEDVTHLRRVISKAKPHEFYHLAGQSSPRLSLELPESTMNSIGMGTLRILEIIRDLQDPPKFLYASSSEIFGSPTHSPQDESTALKPTTPYGAAKAFCHHLCSIYRVAHSMPTCSAILYNHESPRRGAEFVTMKVARAAAAIKKGIQKDLTLGSLSGRRDWGWAPDYVEGMWLMLQQDVVDDFVLATGRLHSVENLVACAFEAVGLNWKDYVKHDPALVNTAEPVAPCGNPTKARRLLGWKCEHSLRQIMDKMVASEFDRINR